MTEDRALEAQVSGLLAATERQQVELLQRITRAVASPRPDLVTVPGGAELPDAEFNQELLAANGDRLLSYLRNIQAALEARVWFSRPALDRATAISKERAARLEALGAFCLEVADAAEEALVTDLRDLGYRDARNVFGLRSPETEKPKGRFWR